MDDFHPYSHDSIAMAMNLQEKAKSVNHGAVSPGYTICQVTSLYVFQNHR